MKTPEHIYQPACARCRDEAGKDRAGVTDTSLCNWHTNDLVLSLRAEVERLKKALGYITDISEANADRAIVEMKRIAHEALDSAPADEEGRDE